MPLISYSWGGAIPGDLILSKSPWSPWERFSWLSGMNKSILIGFVAFIPGCFIPVPQCTLSQCFFPLSTKNLLWFSQERAGRICRIFKVILHCTWTLAAPRAWLWMGSSHQDLLTHIPSLPRLKINMFNTWTQDSRQIYNRMWLNLCWKC